MKRFASMSVVAISVSIVLASAAHAAKPKAQEPSFQGWTTNLEEAVAASKTTGRPIFAFFTGSDWCGYCKKLKAEVLDTPMFQEWASKNVILLELDFPRTIQQEEALKQQNGALQAKYKISGYPTIKYLTANEDEIGTQGYAQGGPEKWLTNASTILGAKPDMIAKPEPAKPAADLPVSRLSILESYKEGLETAQKEGRPLLLVVSKSEVEKLQANLAKFLADDQFADFAEANVVVAHVKEPIESDPEEQEAIAGLRKENNLRPTPVQLLLIDSKSEKVLMKSISVPTAKSFVAQLQRRLAALAKTAAKETPSKG